ncbi:MAG: putative 7-carboxy-7-deazaguanine synthase QueE [Lachnospiraceae bacterium]|nr:putative 7-carboxy-7-deazaguanine synthase QueE [Lachnospiraceae bacterium]
MEYKIAEKFVSINGEGTKAGQLAVFIRLCGCNLNCSYCDTKWANEKDVPFTLMTEEELASYVEDTGVKNITLTGGEPLLDKDNEDVKLLLSRLSKIKDVFIEIETNGSIAIEQFKDVATNISFTMDYKLPSSNMEELMCLDNFNHLRSMDTVKFVAGSENDLKKVKEIIKKYKLTEKCNVYISPVFGNIEPVDIVDFMITNKLNDVNLQLQLHKIIWDPEKKGV